MCVVSFTMWDCVRKSGRCELGKRNRPPRRTESDGRSALRMPTRTMPAPSLAPAAAAAAHIKQKRRGRRRYRDVANSDEASDEEAASPEIQEPAALKPESSWLRDLVCSVGICAFILIALLIALFVQVAHRSG